MVDMQVPNNCLPFEPFTPKPKLLKEVSSPYPPFKQKQRASSGDEQIKQNRISSPATYVSFGKTCTCRTQKQKVCLFGCTCKCVNMQLRGFSCRLSRQPKWLLPVPCYMHRSLSSSPHSSLHVAGTHTSQTSGLKRCRNQPRHYKRSRPCRLASLSLIPYLFGIKTLLHQIVNHNHSKHVWFLLVSKILFRGNSKEREFPNIKYLETLSMMPFHDLSASDSVALEKFLRGDPELHGVDACTCTHGILTVPAHPRIP